MIAKKKREYKKEGGLYSFNFKALKEWNKRQKRGTQAAVIKLLDEKGIGSRSAFYAWLKEDDAPENLERVERLEDLLGFPRGGLLTAITSEKELSEEASMNARIIESRERDSARTIYEKMCDMIRGLEYWNPEIWLMAGIPLTQEGFRYLGNQPHPFEYRDSLIQEIRKAAFDFPMQMRDQLISFVRDAFGDGCYETGMMYFESEEYKAYLKMNNLDDTPDVKELYSGAYIEGLYKKLDEIFAEYLQ
ncbi:MAG: hypothetical protein E7474_06565 [Ruminococcaceae bacterium]|nr:hypothetical protein [Oscillospiraceae bacterium]